MNVNRLIWVLAIVVSLSACASTPKSENTTVSKQFAHSVDRVRTAATDALVVTGFEVQKEESNYVEGVRPRKIGFFVGSGGETVGIWLSEVEAAKTEVRVDTAKSFVGYVGQKNWEEQVLAEMSKSLSP